MWEKQLEAAIEAGVKAIEGILKIYISLFMKQNYKKLCSFLTL